MPMTAFEDQAIYPAAELFLIRQFMRKEGFKPKQWLLGTGLSEEQIRLPETQVSLRQFDIIYHNIYRITQRPDIGLALGHALNISRWGILSTALICARTLGSALEIGNRFRSLVRSRFVTAHSVPLFRTLNSRDRMPSLYSQEAFHGPQTPAPQISRTMAAAY